MQGKSIDRARKVCTPAQHTKTVPARAVIQDAKQHAVGGSAAAIVNMVLATSTYDFFLQMMISATKDDDPEVAEEDTDLAVMQPRTAGVLDPEAEAEERFHVDHAAVAAGKPGGCALYNGREQSGGYTEEISDFACEQGAIRAAMERRRSAREAASAEAQAQVEGGAEQRRL